MQKKTLKIATRKSPLALWQAYYVRDRLLAEHEPLPLPSEVEKELDRIEQKAREA